MRIPTLSLKLRLQHVLPYLPHLAGLCAIAILSVVVSLARISAAPPTTEGRDRWALPAWQPYRAGAAREEMLEAQIWSEDPAHRPKIQTAKVETPPWRFVGTVLLGKNRAAVIALEDGARMRRLTVGEDLPNGAKIKTVGDGVLVYEENGNDQTLKLFDASTSYAQLTKEKK
jgi:hypothetical protein